MLGKALDRRGIAIKAADWVRDADGSGPGLVVRVARDGSWVDVKWRAPGLGEWSKRMRRPRALIVVATIPLPGGWTVTDMTREDEIASERGPSLDEEKGT